jgi:hypothetical protein
MEAAMAGGSKTRVYPVRAAFGAGILCILLAGGCAIDGTHDETSATSSASEPLLGVCLPLTCCFPSGGGWAQDPFEARLQALGCSEPRAYVASYGQSYWWLYSACPLSLDLTALIAQYALVGPYYSRVAVNECLELQAVGGGQVTTAFVEWDPTCPSCSYGRYFNPYPVVLYSTPSDFNTTTAQ